MEEKKIILIQDLLDSRRRKLKELEYYMNRKEELEVKLSYIKREIDLTDHIISLIEKEKIEEINL